MIVLMMARDSNVANQKEPLAVLPMNVAHHLDAQLPMAVATPKTLDLVMMILIAAMGWSAMTMVHIDGARGPNSRFRLLQWAYERL